MKAADFYRAVTKDRDDVLGRLLTLLEDEQIPHCFVGAVAVNAYVEPLVGLDVEIVIARNAMDRFQQLIRDLSGLDSALRLRFETDERFERFISRSRPREVFGRTMCVASVDDVLQGLIWAAADPNRTESQRRMDRLGIARVVEAFPHLRVRVLDQ